MEKFPDLENPCGPPSRRIPGFGKYLRPTRSKIHRNVNGAECLLNTVHEKTHHANCLVLGGDHRVLGGDHRVLNKRINEQKKCANQLGKQQHVWVCGWCGCML
jgi:hypothetical protein